MKHTQKRILSLMMSGVTAASMLPAYLSGLSLPVSANDPTDLTIDFNADALEPEQILEQMQKNSFKEERVATYTPNGAGEKSAHDEIYEKYNTYPWRHVTEWSCNDDPNIVSYWGDKFRSALMFGVVSDYWYDKETKTSGTGFSNWYKETQAPYTLRSALESTDPKDKYVALAEDTTHCEHARDVWEPMVITTDKVLDLNGHKIEIRYDRNRNNSENDRYQNKDPDTHFCWAFEIQNDATLTIIDSSAWRHEGTDGKGTGSIAFTAYMIDPYKHNINSYTTRDLFYVEDGNLIIYDGTFQAGRKKAQLDDSITWDKLKPVIGSALSLGTKIAEYATGINTASGQYKDALEKIADTNVIKNAKGTTGDDDDAMTEGPSDIKKRNGINGDPKQEMKTSTPDQADGRNQTVGEKQEAEKKTDTNKSDENKPAKDDKYSKLAQAENGIVDSVTNKDAIGQMIDEGFGLVNNIIKLCSSNPNTRVVQSIKGTVVKVGANGSFVSYGGNYEGYGSTPYTRNAVVETVIYEGTSKTDWDSTKNDGGVAYIYGGTFNAYNGANVFNMVTSNDEWSTRSYDKDGKPYTVHIARAESAGVYQLRNETKDGKTVPINTANVQVRGGTFRCHYDLMNVAKKEDGDDNYFRTFPGTSGTVNLGPESYNTDLIQDGRIRIVDKYGDGELVLMDERSEEEAGNQGLYHYRLFCSDTELRAKSYLEISPNNDPKIAASHSIQLFAYTENNGKTSKCILPDDGENNIRAPYRQTEAYFDFMFDAQDATQYSVKPNFRIGGAFKPASELDVEGKLLRNSEIWYYPQPLTAEGRAVKADTNEPIFDTPYGNFYAKYLDNGKFSILQDRDLSRPGEWSAIIRDECEDDVTQLFFRQTNKSIRHNLHYFTYKVYRVDPLTRENISESATYGVDEPLITIRYGDSEDSLKCKLPLMLLEKEIKERRTDWMGYKSGDLYRIVLDVEEYMDIGHGDGARRSGSSLPTAKTETSILFRCYSKNETPDTGEFYEKTDYTPVQWLNATQRAKGTEYDTVLTDKYAQIGLINGQPGKVDYLGRKIFDLYYQWWEVDEKGNPLRLIAGTDNIFDLSRDPEEKILHRPEQWNPNVDGKTYVNTIDPNDEEADDYDPETGLPVDKNDWKNYQIHMYAEQTMGVSELNTDGDEYKVSMGTNNTFAHNTDRCYIPENMAGKYLAVKVIAVNVYWKLAYDPKQTFWSHTVKVESGHKPLNPIVQVTYPEREKTENGSMLSYGTYDKPVKIKLNARGSNAWRHWLAEGEYISSITYMLGNGRTKELTGLKLTAEDAKNQPVLKYPDDFYDEGYDKTKIKGGNVNIWVKITTERRGKEYRSSDYSEMTTFRYDVEAESVIRYGKEEETYNLRDIQSGKYENGIQIFQHMPLHATRGWNYADYTNSNAKVATLDEKGYLHFGGELGETTLSVKSPDGTTVSKTIKVVRNIDNFEVSGVKAPVLGEKLDTTSLTVPEDAPYHISDVKWYKFRSEAKDTEVAAENMQYSIEITLAPNEFCVMPGSGSNASYSLTFDQGSGVSETVSGSAYWDWKDGEYVRVIYYTFPAMVNHEAKTIDEIYMNFPTEVKEGDNFLKWLEDVEIYTNGYNEGLKFDITPTYGADAGKIADAYNYSVDSGCKLNHFIKGVQNGVVAEIEIPEQLKELGDVFADKVTLYVNGQESSNIVRFASDHVRVAAPDTLTVSEGDAVVPVKPAYSMMDFDAVVGETVTLRDLLVCSDPRVSVKMDGIVFDYDWDDYFTYDLAEGTWTPKQTLANITGTILLKYVVAYDANSDGYPEYQEKGNYSINKIYGNAEDVPERPDNPVKPIHVQIRVLAPDGTIASDGEYEYDGFTSVIPEMKNAYITDIYDANGKRKSEKFFEDGESYTVHTVSAYSIEVHPGADSVYAFFKDQNNRNVDGIQISADNMHFTTSDCITGLKPDTEYTLSYKMGIDGKLYTKNFRTAKQDYGVLIGRETVTDENLGNLETDHWHYDPESKTLTLKDFMLKDTGTAAKTDEYYGDTNNVNAVIISRDDLTVNLIGDNMIEYGQSDIFDVAVYAEKDLTITGNGNLTIGKGSYGMHSETGDINLNGTGTLTFDQLRTAIQPEKGTVNYTNGSIDYKPYLTKLNDKYYPSGSLLPSKKQDVLNLNGKVHKLDVSAGETADSCETVAENEISGSSGKYLQITPIHSDVNKTVSVESHASGTCEKGCEYHFSCDCGHIGTETFKMRAEEHVLVKHAAKPATCNEPGVTAYWECEHCGERYADEKGTKLLSEEDMIVQPLGHNLIHKEAANVTCTKDGVCEHWACSRCGECYEDQDGTIPLTGEETITHATGHDWVHYNKKAATCTDDGMDEHWKCANCGKYSADKDGTNMLTAEDLKEPATGHIWSEWTVSKEATESAAGEETRSCSRCGETEKRAIPQLTTTTTTATTTTTISTTKPITTTTSTPKATTSTSVLKTTTSATNVTTTTISTSRAATTTTTTTTATTTTTITTTATAAPITDTTTTTAETPAITTTTVTTATTASATITTTTSALKTTTTTSLVTTTVSETTTTATETSTTPPKPSQVIEEDYNGDGELNIADAVILARFVSEDDTLKAEQIDNIVQAKPDQDDDGIVTLLDVITILKKRTAK